MTAETPFPDDNSDLPEELRPIAAKHGRLLFEFALRVSVANTAGDQLLALSRRIQPIRGPVAAMLNAQGDLCNMILAAREWSMDQLIAVMQDLNSLQGRIQLIRVDSRPH